MASELPNKSVNSASFVFNFDSLATSIMLRMYYIVSLPEFTIHIDASTVIFH